MENVKQTLTGVCFFYGPFATMMKGGDENGNNENWKHDVNLA